MLKCTLNLQKVGFVMNEEHNEQLLTEKGYRKYAGEGIDVFFNIDVC